MKAVIDDKIPYIHGLAEQLVDEVCYMPGADIGPADVRDADILLVRTRTRCDKRLLEGSRVRLVVTATIGYDHLDTAWLATAGIQWTNCPGCNASSVCQYVHNALLVLSAFDGRFGPAPPTVGVVGVGHVGSLVADDLQRMGLRVLCCDPPLGLPVTLQQIAAEADIITFHTPLTRDGDCPTFHLADDVFFHRLERRPLLVNTSRGGVVDNVALLAALKDGRVCDAVLDVWEGEPAGLNRDLLERVAIGTPHVAGYSADGKANATRMSLQAVSRFLGIPFTLQVHPDPLPSDYSYGPVTSGPLRLYDPRVDSQRLKQRPELFEWLRGNYPLRREKADEQNKEAR